MTGGICVVRSAMRVDMRFCAGGLDEWGRVTIAKLVAVCWLSVVDVRIVGFGDSVGEADALVRRSGVASSMV